MDKSNLFLVLRQNKNFDYEIIEQTDDFKTQKIICRPFSLGRAKAIELLEKISNFYHGDGEHDFGYRAIIVEPEKEDIRAQKNRTIITKEKNESTIGHHFTNEIAELCFHLT